MDDWEQRWAPYDEATYGFVLAQLQPDDIVLDIGAGDLRLARRIARRVQKVYALERQAELISSGTAAADPMPNNLEVICTDARSYPFPSAITAAVLLMRHCTHFGLYWGKLARTNCRTLLTNARWRFGVERIEMQGKRRPYAQIQMGWFACSCGATGFVPGPPEQLTAAVIEQIQEVVDCPNCLRPDSLSGYPARI